MKVASPKVERIAERTNWRSKLRDYALLAKVRLSLTVVFSALLAFLIGNGGQWDGFALLWLFLGGALITFAANALNEMLEIRADGLMNRTLNRPLPAGRMQLTEAGLFAFLAGIIGVVILYAVFNLLTGILSLSALLLYAFLYTPLKKYSHWAVPVGAIPGAMPITIGWVAATGSLSYTTGILFLLQFLWQFPHFWSIAWVADEDYQKAGYQLLPLHGGRSLANARIISFSAFLLIPAGFLPLYAGFSWMACIACVFTGFAFSAFSIPLVQNRTREAALRLMFGSFIYLPAVLLILLFDRYL